MTLTPKQKQANRLMLATHDLVRAKEFAQALADLRALPADQRAASRLLEEAATISAIVMYARPFKNSFSQGNADKSVDADDLFKLLDYRGETAKARALHRQIIEWRDQAIAHGDWAHHLVSDPADPPRFLLSTDVSTLLLDIPGFVQLADDMNMAATTKVSLLDPGWLTEGQDSGV